MENSYLTKIFIKKINSEKIVVLNTISSNYISYYDFNLLEDNNKKDFLNLVECWWNNRCSVPISIYYGDKLNPYHKCKSFLETKDCFFINGFSGINLKSSVDKRIKRKIIDYSCPFK